MQEEIKEKPEWKILIETPADQIPIIKDAVNDYQIKAKIKPRIPETKEEKIYDDLITLQDPFKKIQERQENKAAINKMLCGLFNLEEDACHLQSSHWDDFFTENVLSNEPASKQDKNKFTVVFKDEKSLSQLITFAEQLEKIKLNVDIKVDAPKALAFNSTFRKTPQLVINSNPQELFFKLVQTEATVRVTNEWCGLK